MAIDKEKKREVAIKTVSIQKICDIGKERHIMREKELLKTLKHPNIIELYGAFKVSAIPLPIKLLYQHLNPTCEFSLGHYESLLRI